MITTDYVILRSNRTTVAVYIEKDGSVTVRAPYKASRDMIDNFVSQKRSWIEKHMAKMKENNICLNYNSQLYFLGEKYPIKVTLSVPEFDGNHFLLPPALNKEQMADIINEIYKTLAAEYIPSRFAEITAKYKFHPKSLRITSAVTRWGSCSGKNAICLSSRLITASPKLIDYVIVHELVHTVHHNHSKKFWDTVEKFVPDYAVCKSRLNEFSPKISYTIK